MADKTFDSETPATLGDIIHLMTILTIEIAAACSSNSRETDSRLVDIATKMDETGDSLTEPRNRWLIKAFAAQLMGTEYGGD